MEMRQLWGQAEQSRPSDPLLHATTLTPHHSRLTREEGSNAYKSPGDFMVLTSFQSHKNPPERCDYPHLLVEKIKSEKVTVSVPCS